MNTATFGLMALQLLAEADVGIPSGLAPWATTGLAGLILAWLFFWHLPGKDKQLEGLISGKDGQITNLIASRDQLVRELITNTTSSDKERRSDFKSALDLVVGHCEREGDKRDAAIKIELEEFGKALQDVRETMESIREFMLKAPVR